MTISLHIERLVLDRLPISARQGPEIQAAVEAELTRLLGERGVSPSLINAGASADVAGGPLRIESSTTPARIGTAIASALHSALAGAAPAAASSHPTRAIT